MKINYFPDLKVFPDSAPRYPNLWIFVSINIAKGYENAYRFAFEKLQKCTEMFNDFGYCYTSEGCDDAAQRRGLQYVRIGDNDEESHDHALHFRFYKQYLSNMGCMFVKDEYYYPVAASVHYEVDRPRKLHPYIDKCPYCGCTGEYEKYYQKEYHNRHSELKNIYVHDPMGLEISLYGTLRGQKVPLISGLDLFKNEYEMDIKTFNAADIFNNPTTAVIGSVFFKKLKDL